jgi:transposase
MNQADTGPCTEEELKALCLEQQALLEKQEEQLHRQVLVNEALTQEIALLKQRLYGKKSEKARELDPQQLTLFDIPEEKNEEPSSVEEIEIPQHKRKKAGRKPLPNNLPVEEIVYELSEKELQCACGSSKRCIGEERSERLEYVPAKLKKIVSIQKKYSCPNCEGTSEEGEKPAVQIAPKPKQLIPKSIATSSLIAHILVGKFVDALPFYRQEQQFARLGVSILRQNMNLWARRAAEACAELVRLLHISILAGPVVHIDETPVQVLKEPFRKPEDRSYMWVLYGGPPGKRAVLFRYDPSRRRTVAKELLGDYSGCVQSDDYSAYSYLHNDEDVSGKIVHITCLAHVRRKFIDVQKGLSAVAKKKKVKRTTRHCDKILRIIRRMYRAERLYQQDGITGDELIEARQRDIVPKFDSLITLVTQLHPDVPVGTPFEKALKYAANNLPLIRQYANYSYTSLDNNVVENLIRPFAIGRKNWMFSGNVEGAEASAVLYSLVQTAKLNKLNPFEYLRFIFDRLPYAESEDDYMKLLPFNVSMEELTR